MTSGLNTLMTARSPTPSQWPTSSSASHGPLVTGVGRGDHLGDPLGAAAGEPAGAHEQLVLADLGLPAADVAAAALQGAAAVDEQVADLAGVAARPRERHAADQEPATDADAAVEVGDVGVPDRGAAQVLGEDAEVGVVAGEHAPSEPLARAAR